MLTNIQYINQLYQTCIKQIYSNPLVCKENDLTVKSFDLLAGLGCTFHCAASTRRAVEVLAQRQLQATAASQKGKELREHRLSGHENLWPFCGRTCENSSAAQPRYQPTPAHTPPSSSAQKWRSSKPTLIDASRKCSSTHSLVPTMWPSSRSALLK